MPALWVMKWLVLGAGIAVAVLIAFLGERAVAGVEERRQLDAGAREVLGNSFRLVSFMIALALAGGVVWGAITGVRWLWEHPLF